MMNQILSILKNVNYIYIGLCFLGLIGSFIYLYVNDKKRFIPISTIVYIVIFVMSFNYFDSLFNSVFSFSYSSIRFYLIILIITNVIGLITVNFEINIFSKIVNYILLISSGVIFVINILLFVNSNISIVDISIDNIIYFIDLDIIIFIGYLMIILSSYIVKNISVEINNYIKRIRYREDKIEIVDDNVIVNNIDVKNDDIVVDSDKFIIDGKDCSFIFNDPNRENVIRNYYILLTNVNARLVNGYTVDENIRINNILNRLNVKDINNLDLININTLSKISIDEYNLLKGYLDS